MDRIIGVITGIACVCLVLSILASHIQELLATYSSKRAATLETAIRTMLADPDLARKFFAHPLIQSISLSRPHQSSASAHSQNARPTYVAAATFRKVLHSVLIQTYAPAAQQLGPVIAKLPDSALGRSLRTVALGSADDSAVALAVENWYDDTMDRVGGLYKRHTQGMLLIVGFMLAVFFNANIFNVAGVLWNSPTARDQASALAAEYSCNGKPCGKPDATVNWDTIQQELATLPLGWPVGARSHLISLLDKRNWPPPGQRLGIARNKLGRYSGIFLGWCVTALAVSLGSPFWFDVLGKFINLRLTGPKPTPSPPAAPDSSSS